MGVHRYNNDDDPTERFLVAPQTEEPESDVPEGVYVIGFIFIGVLVVAGLSVLTAMWLGLI